MLSGEVPKVLMLGHCFPDGESSGPRERAWQLLETLRPMARVHLVAAEDGPIHLSHWRRLRAMVEHLEIVPRHPLTRMLGRTRRRCVEAIARDWCGRTRFDALVCTEAALGRAPVIRSIPMRLCDVSSRDRLDLLRIAEFDWLITDDVIQAVAARKLGFKTWLVSAQAAESERLSRPWSIEEQVPQDYYARAA